MRGVVPVFAVQLTVSAVVAVPLVGLTVNHVALLWAVHAADGVRVTVRGVVPAVEAVSMLAAERDARAPDCVMMMVCPRTVMAPVRVARVVLAAAE